MENLRKLAEIKALEAYPKKGELLNYHNIAMASKRMGYIKGFLDNAQLASEDKKELLEALKLVARNIDDDRHARLRNRMLKLIKKHETI